MGCVISCNRVKVSDGMVKIVREKFGDGESRGCSTFGFIDGVVDMEHCVLGPEWSLFGSDLRFEWEEGTLYDLGRFRGLEKFRRFCTEHTIINYSPFMINCVRVVHTEVKKGCGGSLAYCAVCRERLGDAYVDNVEGELLILCADNRRKCWERAGIILGNVKNVRRWRDFVGEFGICDRNYRVEPYFLGRESD
ncbi:MAG: hypothetical protein Hyperionvirus18_17 [Hyperionvirus sp.]|uniref:Uncharacterized protein n=1 Tax=Hyperionvirus sp. TaxID=2487770 RepID=A0A3G5AD10_9VIRU|nr:MAG: hypothetical protein Hyperionvirus18_17 [Hyperionvirus sp.]